MEEREKGKEERREKEKEGRREYKEKELWRNCENRKNRKKLKLIFKMNNLLHQNQSTAYLCSIIRSLSRSGIGEETFHGTGGGGSHTFGNYIHTCNFVCLCSCSH